MVKDVVNKKGRVNELDSSNKEGSRHVICHTKSPAYPEFKPCISESRTTRHKKEKTNE
jgi:hypothetical protein